MHRILASDRRFV